MRQHNATLSDGVAWALADLAAQQPQLRRLKVNVKIEAQAADDSVLAPLVSEALQEFLETPAGRGDGIDAMSGRFESKAGLDVSWHAMNSYYEHGSLWGMVGVDEGGTRIDIMDRAKLFDHVKAPVPLEFAHMTPDHNVIQILGLNVHREVFAVLASADPNKAYRFRRSGTVIVLDEIDIPLSKFPS